jgi:hypothetical protein
MDISIKADWPWVKQQETHNCVCDCHVGMKMADCPPAAGLVTMANRRYPAGVSDEDIPIMKVYWCGPCIAEAQLHETWEMILSDTPTAMGKSNRDT